MMKIKLCLLNGLATDLRTKLFVLAMVDASVSAALVAFGASPAYALSHGLMVGSLVYLGFAAFLWVWSDRVAFYFTYGEIRTVYFPTQRWALASRPRGDSTFELYGNFLHSARHASQIDFGVTRPVASLAPMTAKEFVSTLHGCANGREERVMMRLDPSLAMALGIQTLLDGTPGS